MSYRFETSCVNAPNGQVIDDMIDHPLEEEVTYHEMLRHVPELAQWAEEDMGYSEYLSMCICFLTY